jgi:RNA polymerase sigma factor (sigma-70 family)
VVPLMFLCGNRALLDAFRRGDRDALAQVYDHYYPSVVEIATHGFSFASGTTWLRFRGAPSAADLFDLVHDVFTAVFAERARLGYSGTSPYGAYLAQVTRNRIISRLRADQRMRLEADGADEDDAVAEASPEEQLMVRQTEDAVRGFLARQSETVRALARLRFGEDLSQEQAAASLGLTRKQVRRLEDELRRGLVRHLGQRGGRPSGALLSIVGLVA